VKQGRTRTTAEVSQSGQKITGFPRKDFCVPFCGFAALREVLEDRKANTLEQKDAKIAKKSKTGNDFRRFQGTVQYRVTLRTD
jgi:hypothetical protein